MAEAYETLIDPSSREMYDAHGADGGPDGMGWGQDDLFEQMFSGMGFGMGGPGPRRRPGQGGRKRKGESSSIEYTVTLEDLYNGKAAHFNIERGVVCATCKGSVLCIEFWGHARAYRALPIARAEGPIRRPRSVPSAMVRV